MLAPCHRNPRSKVYSQAVRANGFLFTAQIALDPNTNTFLEGDVAQQTERVLENLKAILTHAGLTLSHVVKTTVFLKDFAAYAFLINNLWKATGKTLGHY
jgi:enamine deaminase RidA (YjgF/YER057c/UK114 family)